MLGVFPLLQIHKSTLFGPNTTPSRLEILSVSSSSFSFFPWDLLKSKWTHFLCCFSYKGLLACPHHLFSHHFQCSCTHQVKIPWFKSQNKTTSPATWQPHSYIWKMATLYLTSLHAGCSTSPVGFQGTVKRSRSYEYLCSLGMVQLTLPLMVLVHCQTVQHPLTLLYLGRCHCHLLLHQQTDFPSCYLLLLAQGFLQSSMPSCEGHNYQDPKKDRCLIGFHVQHIDSYIKFWFWHSFQWFKRE